MTQKEIIKRKLMEDGEITSVWAIQNRILRLSERIRDIQKEGWTFSKHFVVVGGKKTRTYRYVVQDRPKKTVYDLIERDGVKFRVPRYV